MTCFNWLHLTDLHLGMKKQNWLWPDIQEIFFNDLKWLHDQCGPWDLVLFTGDLTYQGSEKQFVQLNDILRKLFEHLEKLGSSPKFLAIPGNHDLKRPPPRNRDDVFFLQKIFAEEEQKDELFWETERANSRSRKVVSSAFRNYTAWWEKSSVKPKEINTGILPGDFSYTFEKHGAKLGILGLNTSFLQLDNADDYKGRLALHARQFHEACRGDGIQWVKKHHTCLLMTHHPSSWLNNNSRQQLHQSILSHGHFAAHLCGHMHAPASESVSQDGAEIRTVCRGRSLFGMKFFDREKQPLRLHGYSAGKIELQQNEGLLKLWPREAKLQGRQWEIIPDSNYKLDRKNQHTPSIVIPLNRPYVAVREKLLSTKKSYGFLNRDREREDIYKLVASQNSLIVIDAPAGYGKTYLMKEIQRKYEEEENNWKCVFIEFSMEFKSKGIDEIRNEIVRQLTDGKDKIEEKDSIAADLSMKKIMVKCGKKIIFLFDGVEGTHETLTDWLREFVSKCKTAVTPFSFFAVFSGRYVTIGKNGRRWNNFAKVPLSAFTQDVVTMFIKKAAESNVDNHGLPAGVGNEKYAGLAKRITDLSAGHPKIIHNLVMAFCDSHGMLLFDSSEEKYLFEKYIKAEINEIVDILDDETQAVFEVLSIFRKFSLTTITALQERREIAKSNSMALLGKLGFIADQSEYGFFSNSIVRRLLLKKMRILEKDRYCRLNRMAQDIYQTWIDNSVSRQSSLLLDFYIRQSIYHALQCNFSSVDLANLHQCVSKAGISFISAYGKNEEDPNYKKYLEELMLSDEDISSILTKKNIQASGLVNTAFSTSWNNE